MYDMRLLPPLSKLDASAVKTKTFRIGSVVFILVQVALQGSYRYDRSVASIRVVRPLSLRCTRISVCTCLWTPVHLH